MVTTATKWLIEDVLQVGASVLCESDKVDASDHTDLGCQMAKAVAGGAKFNQEHQATRGKVMYVAPGKVNQIKQRLERMKANLDNIVLVDEFYYAYMSDITTGNFHSVLASANEGDYSKARLISSTLLQADQHQPSLVIFDNYRDCCHAQGLSHGHSEVDETMAKITNTLKDSDISSIVFNDLPYRDEPPNK